jgi:hypothetical protein
VTFRPWRTIFWLQTALAGFGLLLVAVALPEMIHRKRSDELPGLTTKQYARKIWSWTNPLRVIRLFRYPNLLIINLASSAMVWNQYALLTPIRYVLNPRFGLTTPLQSGFFYLAPGASLLVGTFFGGKWADHVVIKYIEKRGERIPEDRSRSCLLAMGIVVPGCIMIYGWGLQKDKCEIPLPVIMMFSQGVGQLFCFPNLSTYCLDVMHTRSVEVVAGNYLVRYFFAAFGTAVCLPAIKNIGIGGFSTICAAFLVVATMAVMVDIKHGKAWREKVDARKFL